MEIYCPTCGRSSKDVRFIGEFCFDCATAKLGIGLPTNAEIEVCKHCRRIRVGAEFEKPGNDSLAAALSHVLKLKGCSIKVKSFDDNVAVLKLACDTEQGKVGMTREVTIKKAFRSCRDCSRMKAGYYEAIVQLRGTPKTVEKMHHAIENFLVAGGGFISKVVEHEKGVDLYASDKRAISAYFSQRKLNPKRSYTLYGMKNGKKLYRNIYMLTI